MLVTKYSIHFTLGSGYAFYIRVKGLQSAFVQAAYKHMLVLVIALGQTTERAATTDEKLHAEEVGHSHVNSTRISISALRNARPATTCSTYA